MRSLTHFGQRADWSHDGKRILFIQKTYGDVFELDLETGIIRPMTHHYKHSGYTRALYLSNGDILLSGSRTVLIVVAGLTTGLAVPALPGCSAPTDGRAASESPARTREPTGVTCHWDTLQRRASASRTYQFKLNPKWIYDHGRTMYLIWSDAGCRWDDDHFGHSSYWYRWNQVKINLELEAAE